MLKARATLSKLISLHKELNEEDEVVRSYCSLLRLYEGSLSESEASEVSRVSLDFVEYVIVREKLVRDHWQEVGLALYVLCLVISDWSVCDDSLSRSRQGLGM